MLAVLLIACGTAPSTDTKVQTVPPTDTDLAPDTTGQSIPDLPPDAEITAPADGAEVGVDTVLFGSASDAETPAQNLFAWWDSDIDGGLANIDVAPSGIFADEVTLSPGPHVITLVVEDAGGNRVERSISVTAVEPTVPDTADTGTPPPVAALCPVVFDTTSFTLFGANNPTLSLSNLTDQVLIPDNVQSASAAAIWAGGLTVPFTLDFEYTLDDDDGTAAAFSTNSADGIAVQLLKDPAVYAATAPPNGGTRGVLDDGTGYAVELKLYETRELLVTRGTGQVLYSAATDVFTGGAWRPVVIDVDVGMIEVTVGGITHTVTTSVDTTFDGLIVSAATGGSDGLHAIRDLCITQ